MSEYATIVKVASECQVLDWKTAAKNTVLDVGKWHVQFSKCKRFYLKKSTKCNQMVGLRGELHYRNDSGQYKNICRKNKNTTMISPNTVSQGVRIKQVKLTDIDKLLSAHYGNKWRDSESLGFFANIVHSLEQEVASEHEDLGELLCEAQEELPSLMI